MMDGGIRQRSSSRRRRTVNGGSGERATEVHQRREEAQRHGGALHGSARPFAGLHVDLSGRGSSVATHQRRREEKRRGGAEQSWRRKMHSFD
ncbi:unnamed protein product [Linum trigynum]|uniref:Uncharacterized protein n=1 Tax=Linum trigynum TaxID=586398 RepID=A0AAV2FG06_9ROSI